ncbi:hypothetical protein MKW98_017320, partial [Papaver atlanticum]
VKGIYDEREAISYSWSRSISGMYMFEVVMQMTLQYIVALGEETLRYLPLPTKPVPSGGNKA